MVGELLCTRIMEAHGRINRGIWAWSLLGLSLLASILATPAWSAERIATGSADSAKADFPAFCRSWMQMVSARESDNRRAIQWRRDPSGFEGEYIGYGEAQRCEVKTATPTGVPVGRVVYREFRYRKSGPSVDAAAQSAPVVVDVTEITEIFRYAGGKWVY
jgi:hypothetical protein